MTEKTLQGKVALVTGGGGGIAKEFARALGQAGACVVLSDINAEACKSAAAE